MSDPSGAQQAATREMLAKDLVAEVRGFYPQITASTSTLPAHAAFIGTKPSHVPMWEQVLGITWRKFVPRHAATEVGRDFIASPLLEGVS